MAIFGPIRDVPKVEQGLVIFLRQVKSAVETLISALTQHTLSYWAEVNVFYNSWENYGGIYSTAAYLKDDHGFVHLKGLIKSGTVTSPAFLLPVDCRPSKQIVFSVISNAAAGRVDVTTEGWVTPDTPSNNAWVSLDGLSFYAG